MCFKKTCPAKPPRTAAAILLATVLASGSSGTLRSAEVIDCLLARVNDQPVTLFDVKILEAFGLFQEERPPDRRALLDRWIGLKIVIDLVKERIAVPPERVAVARDEALSRMGAERAESTLAAFGLEPDDLLPYFEQKLVFGEIILMRFGRGAIVTLREIEDYYRNTYAPAERLQGAEPLPILEVLDRLEALLRAEKIGRQASAWIQILRRQADVQVLDACLGALDRE
jgi:hypothetical protein